MLQTQLLTWLQLISSWYILVPLGLIIYRWKTHDVVRRRVAWYVIFNLGFTASTLILDRINVNNMFLFYLASPSFLWIVYRIFEPIIGTYKVWNLIKYLVIGFTIFVLIDMLFIEDFRKFPDNIYPLQEVIILFIVYYFLYIFSKEARQDFSILWVCIGIGVSALLLLISLIYNPYLGFSPNTFGYFVWTGLGSISDIIAYSFVTYGVYIAKPKSIH